MYLSRLILNPLSRAVQRDLADCGGMHRTLMRAFPAVEARDDARAQLGVLYRVETSPRAGSVVVLVQSRVLPDWAALPAGYLLPTGGEPVNPACKPVAALYDRLQAGRALTFRLRANPTRKIDTGGAPGERRNGRRVELRGEAAQLDWLRRKGEQGGFAVRAARVLPAPVKAHGATIGQSDAAGAGPPTRAGGRLTFAAVLYEGELVITDAARFRQALASGIGPGKAFGFGLLSVAPAGQAV
jgi:CRISPR system Cascade subunit CasE